jgi:hypothetical protein
MPVTSPTVTPEHQAPSTGQAKAKMGLLERTVEAVERHSVWALAGLLVLSGAVVMYMGRGLSFYYDEWEWLLHDYGGGIQLMLHDHAGNISFFPAAIYKVLFRVVGFNHYAVFRLDVVILNLICGALIYVMAARRIPRVPALLAAALILFLGSAWEDLLWGFQVGYLLSVASGLATLALLERSGRRNDIAAMLCLVVAAGSSSLGVPIMVGVGVELARQRRRAWIVLVPAALYVLWYLSYGVSQITQNGVLDTPSYSTDLAASAFGGLVGRGLEWGRPLALVGLLAVVRHLTRPFAVSARLASLLAAVLTLWIITGLARSTLGAPESSRYIYLGAVLIVLIGVELLRGVTITPRMSAIATPIVILCAFTSLTVMHTGALGLRTTSKTVIAQLGALELARAYAPPSYRPNPEKAPPVYAGLYLHAVRSIGSSPADTPAEILASEPPARAAADAVLLALEAPSLRPLGRARLSPLAPAPTITSLNQGTRSQQAECVQLRPLAGGPMTSTLNVPSDGVVIRNEGSAPAALALRRFGATFDPLPDSAASHSENVLSLPADAAQIPWQLQLVSATRLSVCGLLA